MGSFFTGPIEISDAGTDADQDIFVLVAATGRPIILHGFELYSSVTSAAAVKLELVRRSAAGTGGSAVTEEDLNQAGDLTAETTMTTLVTTPGAEIALLKCFRWEQLGPLVYIPTPAMQIQAHSTGIIALHGLTSFANAALDGYVVWEEL